MKYRRKKNLLRALILGFAVAAIVASTAQARVSNYNTSAQEARTALNQTYTPQALKALELRSEAMNKLYQAESVRPDDRSGIHGVKPEAVQAVTDINAIQRQVEADRIAGLVAADSKRPDDKAGMHGPGIVQTPELVTTNGDGFDWTDAGIGAGTAFGIALVLMSGFALSRRRQSGLAV